MVKHAREPKAKAHSRGRRAVTLVELLAVVAIITVLMAILFPALNAAREASRQTACSNNLRQFGIGLQNQAQKTGAYCSGAFDWMLDGPVTEVGWVADLVQVGVPPGKMLCPSNPAQIAGVFNDLLGQDASAFDSCVDRIGTEARLAPDGTPIANPCRIIASAPLDPGSEARRLLVETEVLGEHYNTNYTASWWLVRSGVHLDSSGNLRSLKPGCSASLWSRNSTFGPLTIARADSATTATSFIPMLGCGGIAGPLAQKVGPHDAGTMTTLTMTRGPVVKSTMAPINFPSGTPYEGADGWWAGWTHTTLQDFRSFAPVHRGQANLLFADGSVRAYYDANQDGLLNNGFEPNAASGFTSSIIELPEQDVYSHWTLNRVSK